MKKVTIEGIEYNLPNSWDDITLGQQIQVSIDSEKLEEPLKKLAIMSGYCRIPLQDLKRMKISTMTELFKCLEFINSELPSKPIMEFKFKNNDYWVAQNLMESEFQDYISFQNAIHQYSGSTYQALPMLIAIMAKRKKADGLFESIDDYNIQERANEFNDLSIGIANGLSLFFCTAIGTSKLISELFSNPDVVMQVKMLELENILKPQAGRGWLTRCAFGILRTYLKSIKRRLSKPYTSTPQKSYTMKWLQIFKRKRLKKPEKKGIK